MLLDPLQEALGAQGKIVFSGILDKVLSLFQISFYSALIVSSPLWFYALWRFVRPGLRINEIRLVRFFVLAGFFLFIAGVAFGYFLVFPITFKMLINFGFADIQGLIGIKGYLLLAFKVLLFLGLVFQFPNLLVILGFVGWVTKYSLRKMRRYVYVALAILSALLTPPDVLTMLSLWIPLIVLFEIGVLAVALIVHPIIERRDHSL